MNTHPIFFGLPPDVYGDDAQVVVGFLPLSPHEAEEIGIIVLQYPRRYSRVRSLSRKKSHFQCGRMNNENLQKKNGFYRRVSPGGENDAGKNRHRTGFPFGRQGFFSNAMKPFEALSYGGIVAMLQELDERFVPGKPQNS
jgi:hypothetical protein